MSAVKAALCLFIALLTLIPNLAAERRHTYEPYRSIFEIREHVDGSPLLVDGRFEFYLFPDAKREKTPDRSSSCGTRIFVQSVNLVVGLIRSAAAARR